MRRRLVRYALEYAEASLNTLSAYEHVLGLFAVEHADLTLADLEPPQGGGVVRAFLDRHWSKSSAATRRQRLAIVRSFLTWLVGEGLLPADPAVNIRAPKQKRRERQSLFFDEVEALIASQPTVRDQVALSLLHLPGAQQGRATPLAGSDIDLEERIVLVHGKGGHEDTLPLAFERLHDALRLYGWNDSPARMSTSCIRAVTRSARCIRGQNIGGSRSACAAPAFLMPGACTTSAERLPMLFTPSRMTLCSPNNASPLRHSHDTRLPKPEHGAPSSRNAPARGKSCIQKPSGAA